MKPTGTHIPRLYGLPKTHKKGVPLRPILDMINSPYHALAKWLAKLIEPIRKEMTRVHTVRDTFEFVDMIQQHNMNGRTMLSLDVSSLFTQVPLNETIDYLCTYIEEKERVIGLPTNTLKRLLFLCTSNIQFMFNNDIYRQKDGVAMGSPLAPLLADIFMSKLENQHLKSIIAPMVVYKRYVDDIFCITTQNCDLENMLQLFNQAHPNITFTMEIETDATLSFLDVCLQRRTDNSLKRSIHRKSTWSGQYLHFRSFVPLTQKENLFTCLLNRARRICSQDTFQAEVEHLRSIFEKNGYPTSLIERLIQAPRSKPKNPSVPKKNVYIAVPFKGDTAARHLKLKLSETVHKTFYAAHLRIFFTSTPIIRTSIKDILPKSVASNCVYKFDCTCGVSYVGRTTRRLSERIREHLPAWFSRGEIKSINSSILAHLVDTGHTVDIQKAFKVIYCVQGRKSRLLRHQILSTGEAIGIRILKPLLCAQKNHVRTLDLPWPSVNDQSNVHT
ncbi:MAG: reverse transcriptase domain-containing protein [Aeromonas sp.]